MTLEQVNEAMMTGRTVVHTHMGISAQYKVSGVITRFSRDKGWTYSLELKDINANTVVIAALEDTEVSGNG